MARRCTRASASAGLAILGVAILAGGVRILPWIVAPHVPLRVAFPFARALLAVGMETTLLAAPSIGWAFCAAVLVERGEARALFATGASPAGVVRTTLVAALACALLTAAASLAWGREAAAPGRLARSLVEESKASCGQRGDHAAFVPFVGLTWLCFPEAKPRLAGQLPAGGGAFSAEDLTISDDLRSLEFSDLRLLLGEKGSVAVRAQKAEIRGLSPWGRGSNLTAPLRALLLATTGPILALLAATIVLARSIAHRLRSLLVGAAGPIGALVAMSRMEQGDHAPWTYLAVPAAGLVCLFVASALVQIRLRGPTWSRV
ncbi:MAG: hypothetical protein ABW133_09850 [Polyangiaceae bacterium]